MPPTRIRGGEMPGIDLVQRGEPVVLTRREFEDRWVDALAALSASRVISLRLGRDHVLVTPQQFVGTARTTSGPITIRPKRPALVAELRRAFPLANRSAAGSAFDLRGQRAGHDPFAEFISALDATIDAGFPFRYVRTRTASSSPRGQFDVSATIRKFASRGIDYRAVTWQKHRAPEPDLAQLVTVTTDLLLTRHELGASERSHLERSALLFGGRESLSLDAARELAARTEFAQMDRRDLVRLIAAIRALLDIAATPDDTEVQMGRARFRFSNVDALWERGVCEAIRSVLSDGTELEAHLHPLKGRTTPLFPDGGPDIDPDVLVMSGSRTLMVVDAKDYEAVAPDASAVYQVAAYSRSLGASSALLVYLTSGEEWMSSFGDDSVTIVAIGVNASSAGVLNRLRERCRSSLEQLLATTGPRPASPAAE